MTVLSVWEMSLPFLPSHSLCDPAHTFFSLFNANTHTRKQTARTPQSDVEAMKLTLSLETVASTHKQAHHSGQVHTCPPVDRKLNSWLSRSESCCLYSCFSFYPLPLVSVQLSTPPCHEINISKRSTLCCTHQLPSIRLVSNWEGIQTGP